jgi:diacylglycerol kinase family enzyme
VNLSRTLTAPVPVRVSRRGAGLAILVNANAKRGGRRVAAQIAGALPGAKVRLTRSTEEIATWLRAIESPRAMLAAGGDGTVMALLNALWRVKPEPEALPTVGVLPLGTGNAWAHALGAPKLHQCLELLADSRRQPPTRHVGLIEVEGKLTHFAGAGWDAMILEDYGAQLDATAWPGRRLSKSVYGYLAAAALRTLPKIALYGNPRVVIENLGESVFSIDSRGEPRRMRSVGPGAVLYDGPAGTAAVGTCPEYGYRFRAFPFAERMPGFFNLRVLDRDAVGALWACPRLWKGAYSLAGLHDWLATHVRMTFSRPVPIEMGGDLLGRRQCVEFRAPKRGVHMLDWCRLLCR